MTAIGHHRNRPSSGLAELRASPLLVAGQGRAGAARSAAVNRFTWLNLVPMSD
jgi:hypothetical protein